MIGPYSREIYERVMLPLVQRGVVEVWHWPHLHRIEYRARGVAK